MRLDPFNFFNARDFVNDICGQEDAKGLGHIPVELAISRANRVLRNYIEKCPTIYSASNEMKPWNTVKSLGNDDKFEAKLMFIQRIEPCKHQVKFRSVTIGLAVDQFDNEYATVEGVCMDCGAKVKPNWIAK